MSNYSKDPVHRNKGGESIKAMFWRGGIAGRVMHEIVTRQEKNNSFLAETWNNRELTRLPVIFVSYFSCIIFK